MTQDKMRRIITACVSAATVLFVLLLGYLTYQWVTISVQNKREAQLNAEIAALEEQIAKGEEDAEYYESVLGKEWLAIHFGWQAGDK